MKKQFIAFFAGLFILIGTASAQEGSGRAPRMTTDEKVVAAMEKVDATLKPSESVRESVKVIMYEFYTNQQKAMQELRASGSASREDVMKIRQELTAKRDEQLKQVLTAEQMTRWTKEIEPGLTAQRGNAEQKQ